jgi:hypothetical protein
LIARNLWQLGALRPSPPSEPYKRVANRAERSFFGGQQIQLPEAPSIDLHLTLLGGISGGCFIRDFEEVPEIFAFVLG